MATWGEIKPQQCNPELLGQMILKSLLNNGTKIAQINAETEVQMTYHDIWLETVRIAQNLQKREYKPREVFSFMVDHADHLLPTVLASICLACPFHAMHPLLSKQEIITTLSKVKPSAIFCAVGEYNRINEALKEMKCDIKIFIIDGKINGLESIEDLLTETGIEDSFVPIRIDPENDVVAIFCSSGTTGPAKSLTLSYGLLVPWLNGPEHYAEGVVFCFDSAYWSIYMYLMMSCIKCGSTRILIPKPFSPELQLEFMQKFNVTTLWTGLFQLVACLKNENISSMNLSMVRNVCTYGAKMTAELAHTTHSYFRNAKITAFYGMTEIGVAYKNVFECDGSPSKGEFSGNCVVKIANDNTESDQAKIGEVCVKNRYKFLGYLDDPVLSASFVDHDGFVKTGDIGYVDDSGSLIVMDRKKTSILNVFYFRGIVLPTEIENLLINLPSIQEVCVVGVQITDGSELPAAIIAKKPNENISEQDIFNIVAENFPNRSKLRAGVYFVDSLPKTYAGKISRSEIIKFAAESFKEAKKIDSILESFLSDIPEAFRKLFCQTSIK